MSTRRSRGGSVYQVRHRLAALGFRTAQWIWERGDETTANLVRSLSEGLQEATNEVLDRQRTQRTVDAETARELRRKVRSVREYVETSTATLHDQSEILRLLDAVVAPPAEV